MIEMHASVTCDYCGFKVEMQGDYRPGVVSHKIPPEWEVEYDHGLNRHYCEACKVLPKFGKIPEQTR